MARYPNVFCLNCGSNKKMVYDAVLSTKDRCNTEKEITVYWCMKCDIIIRIQKINVHDKVTSARVTIFKNKQ
jgi:NMD protein affecting ribosome stability and mRNA decay